MGDRLETHTTKDGLTLTFEYNVDGIRTKKTVTDTNDNSVTTKYHLDGDLVTYETDGTTEIYYTYGPNSKLISMNLDGVEYFYVRNLQDDIIGLLDKSGTQVVTYQYDTWGQVTITKDKYTTLTQTLGELNPYRYRGYRYDSETGLYYINARYYNPEWGRFLNADSYGGSTGELLSHNVFAYSLNNPVNYVDPSGNIPIPLLIWGAITIVGAIDSGYSMHKAYKNEGATGAAKVAAQELALNALGPVGKAAKYSDELYGVSKKIIDKGKGNDIAKEPFVPDEYWRKKAPQNATPGSKIDHYRDYNGKIEKSTVIYDNFGRQKYRIDHSDHSMPKDHSVPHLHEYKYGPGYHPEKGMEFRYNFWRIK